MSFLGGNLANLHIPTIGGIKKQFSKADQMVSEKMAGAEHTNVDEDFRKLEQATDVYIEMQGELQLKTREFINPNPNVRAKMITDSSISMLGVGVASKVGIIPIPEKALGDSMEKGAKKTQRA